MQRILQNDYADNCKCFAPVELVRRLLLPIFIVIDPGNLVSKSTLTIANYNTMYTPLMLIIYVYYVINLILQPDIAT